MPLLPLKLFVKIVDMDSDDSLESEIIRTQNEHASTLKEWETHLPIHKIKGEHADVWKDNQGDQLVIPLVSILLRKIMRIWHNHYRAGHPGRDKMTRRV